MLGLDNISQNHIMTLTQGNIAKVKVGVYTCGKNFFLDYILTFTGHLE